MRAYIIEYRSLIDKASGTWTSKISQEGYTSLEAAQRYIETRAGNPGKVSNWYYQTEHFEEYYIHDARIIGEEEE